MPRILALTKPNWFAALENMLFTKSVSSWGFDAVNYDGSNMRYKVDERSKITVTKILITQRPQK